MRWFYKAANQEHSNAQLKLGRCFMHGFGVRKEPSEALRWYHRAAKQGNYWAQYELGKCYECSLYVERNLKKASKWLQRAAEQGDPKDKKYLGDFIYRIPW